MVARYYPAVVDRSLSGFGISFPDLPGCVSAGATVEEAIERAYEALGAHIELMLEHDEPIPEPSGLDLIEDDGQGEVVLKTLVRVDLPGRAVRLSITMDEALVHAVDRAAASQGFTRSGFLAEAARRLLREQAAA
jgi:predicted RNase H-like HicB family nuclease